jgi:hypothetical protein
VLRLSGITNLYISRAEVSLEKQLEYICSRESLFIVWTAA